MTDRELLELAAKAIGMKLVSPGEGIGGREPRNAETIDVWNPLTDDGDAFRLSVTLSLDCMGAGQLHDGTACRSVVYPIRDDFDCLSEPEAGDPCAAMRRAIVRAAAEIGCC